MGQNKNFYRESYIDAINTVEQRDPRTGIRRVDSTGKPISKYVCNKDEEGFKKVKLTRSYLRSEVLLQQNLTQYVFPILQNVAANNGPNIPGTQPTEQRLKLQDVFFCNRLGFYIYWAQAVTTVGASVATTNEFRFLLFTAPNEAMQFFGSSLGGGGWVDPVQMYALWTTGQLQVTVNNDVLTPAWDMLQHLYQPMLQGLNGTGPGWAAAGVVQSYFTPQRMDTDGLIIVEPNWVLNGGNDNEYVINYPQSLATMGIVSITVGAVTATPQCFLVLKLEGFLCQNVSGTMDVSKG